MAEIGMVLENDYPSDVRLEKEASALQAAGHRVHLLCLDFGRHPLDEEVGPIHVHRRRLRDVAYRKLHPTLLRLPLYPSMWMRWIEGFARERRLDVFHVHDLPVAGPALRVGRKLGLPTLVDLHENYPAAIEGWGFDRGWMGGLLYSIPRWKAYEREVCRAADAVIVVVDEARDHVLEYGVAPEKIAVVSNTERVSFGHGVEAVEVGGEPPVRFLYIGGFGPHRGLHTAIDAVARLERDVPIRLEFVGRGKIEGDLREQVTRLGVDDRVAFRPWVPLDAVAPAIGGAHVGLVPHVRSDHTETTIPHKLFQYMAMGRPVVVSDCAPLKRVVEGAGAGAVFRSGDPAALAAALAAMVDPDRRRRCGKAARDAVVGIHRWERDAEALCGVYDQVLARR